MDRYLRNPNGSRFYGNQNTDMVINHSLDNRRGSEDYVNYNIEGQYT